jgi:hypothetical protein
MRTGAAAIETVITHSFSREFYGVRLIRPRLAVESTIPAARQLALQISLDEIVVMVPSRVELRAATLRQSD